jgi:hypothetical protein
MWIMLDRRSAPVVGPGATLRRTARDVAAPPVSSRRTEPALVEIRRVVADVEQAAPETLDASFG